MKMLENLLQSSEIFENLRKQSKIAFKIFGKSSGVFGNFWHFRKTLETVQKCFSDVFFFIFGKSSEIPGVFKNHRKISGREIGTVHNGSQTLKSFGAAF